MSSLQGICRTVFQLTGHSFFFVLGSLYPFFVLVIKCFVFSFYSIGERKILHKLVLFHVDVSMDVF